VPQTESRFLLERTATLIPANVAFEEFSVRYAETAS